MLSANNQLMATLQPGPTATPHCGSRSSEKGKGRKAQVDKALLLSRACAAGGGGGNGSRQSAILVRDTHNALLFRCALHSSKGSSDSQLQSEQLVLGGFTAAQAVPQVAMRSRRIHIGWMNLERGMAAAMVWRVKMRRPGHFGLGGLPARPGCPRNDTAQKVSLMVSHQQQVPPGACAASMASLPAKSQLGALLR